MQIHHLDGVVQLFPFDLQTLWEDARQFSTHQSLLCEMLVRGNMRLENPDRMMMTIVDVGAHVCIYYLGLERQLEDKRRIDLAVEPHRVVKILDYLSTF